ncbi:MAG: single-stranded-DNA-specific exonuclease RecJ, partial [Faecalimonas sp.]|nr:single-stranded-DNA-specific exonuclease RecJ [Faecalimonas sp.]
GAPFQEIAEKFQISSLLARLIRNRDVVGDAAVEEYLNGTLADLHDGILMKDMDRAVDLLQEKLEDERRIRIIGDYDIDGINATYILLEGFRALGAKVDVDIPDRMKDGYGLNQNLIERAYRAGVDTIVTCDNGIAAVEEIAYAKRLGMTVIVTDHHEIPYEGDGEDRSYVLPPADAVIDPKQTDCSYPFKGLCGAAVAYKLIETLFNVSGRDAEDLDYLMENVAIATIGDVMDLVGENRIFVKQGLEMLKRTRNLGLKALLECTGVDVEHLSPYHVGFVIGPCLNASGRLDTAKRALELLCAKSKKEADVLAGDLKALNDNRKDLTALAVEQAISLVEESGLKEDKVLVVYLPDCHESLAGIVAGRIREKFYKPAFVLTKAEEGVKGSGRSIESYHMYEALHECKSLLTRFGGHKMAAGVSLCEEHIEDFRRMLNEGASLEDIDFVEKVSIDLQLPFRYVDIAFVEELKRLEPFGKGNEKPLFVEKDIRVLRTQKVGKNQNVLKLRVQDASGTVVDAVYFGDVARFEAYLVEHCNKLAMTYYPTLNSYQGRTSVQLIIQNYQ